MVRRYDDVVEVRERALRDEPAPEAFLWRGRVYRVREVLGHWHERRSWWTEDAARAVHGDDTTGRDTTGRDTTGRDTTGRDTTGRDPGDAARAARVATDPGADRHVWRVEASAGRSAAPGVYDLCRHDASDHPWRLLRVAD